MTSFNNFTGSQRSCGKVMFSVICVCLSICLSVCLSICEGGLYRALVHMYRASAPSPRDMFKLVQLGPHWTGPPDKFKLETCMVVKWAVGILLECFLVLIGFNLEDQSISSTDLFTEYHENVKCHNRARYFYRISTVHSLISSVLKS